MADSIMMGLTYIVFTICIYSITLVATFNIDIKNPYIYNSVKDTYFGYSVAFNHDLRSIVVGAPFSNDTNDGNHPWGSVFSCRYHTRKDRRTCKKLHRVNEIKFGQEVRDNQMMMGATVYSDNYRTIACAPRYQTKIEDDSIEKTLVNGKCDVIYPVYNDESWVWRPCVGKSPTSAFGYCQVGFSGKLLDNKRMVSGGPSFDASVKLPKVQGVLAYYSESSKFTDKTGSKADYLGYSVGSGKLSTGDNSFVIGGAPRANLLTGEVVIYQITLKGFQISYTVSDPENQPGSYFGSSLAVADIDGNGIEDLIIGAPYYSSGQFANEGAGFVYLNSGYSTSSNGMTWKQTLYGDKEKDACFGFSIGSIGDLNKDGKKDIVIGAPWGGSDGQGVVYVYYGTGKEDAPLVLKQKLVPKEMGGDAVKLNGFGYSFAEYYPHKVEGGKPGIVLNDVDKNEFPDLGIGAYRSDSVVIFRSRPVITISGKLILENTKKIDLFDLNPATICKAPDGIKYKCMHVKVAFTLSGPNVGSGGTNVQYTLDVDSKQKVKRSFFLFTKDGKKVSSHTDVMNVRNVMKVDTLQVYLVNNTKEVVHEMELNLKWDIKDSGTCNNVCPVSNQMMDVSTSKRIPYIKGCSNDGNDVCNADLQLKLKKSVDGGIIQSGITKVVNITVEIKNNGENAFLNTLHVQFPSGIQPEKVVIENYKGLKWKPNYKLEKEKGLNYLKVVLSNPIRQNTVEKVVIKFGVSSLIKSTQKQIDLKAEVFTQSEEMKPIDNVDRISIGVILVANLTVTGNVFPEQVKWKKGVTSTSIPGQRIIHTFLLQNRGPSGVDTSDVVIKFPESIDNRYILNIIKIDLKGSGKYDGKPGECDVGKKLNPVGLNNTDGILGVNVAMSSNNSTRSGRRRREVYQGLDCGGDNIGCRVIKCKLKNLKKSDSIEVTITSTLVEATFETYIKVNRKIGVSAKFTSKTVQKPTKDAAKDTVEVFLTVITPHVTYTAESKPLPWWIILICVLAALLIIVIVYTILYKKKFFERKRPPVDEEEQLNKQNGDLNEDEE